MKIYYSSLVFPFLFGLFNLIYFALKIQNVSFILPIFGLLVALINGFFFFFLYKKDKRLAYFFQGSAFLSQALILIFLILS